MRTRRRGHRRVSADGCRRRSVRAGWARSPSRSASRSGTAPGDSTRSSPRAVRHLETRDVESFRGPSERFAERLLRKCADALRHPTMTSTTDDYPRDMIGYGPTRRTRAGRVEPTSQCSSCSTTRRAASTASCTATRSPRRSCRCDWGAGLFESSHERGVAVRIRSRAGLWRVLRVFDRRGLPLTIFGVATALARNPEAVAAFNARGDEIACHGLSWLSYQLVEPEVERAHMAEAVRIMTELTGVGAAGLVHRPGLPADPQTRRRARWLPVRLRLVRR